MLKVVDERLKRKVGDYVDEEEQYGFRKGKGKKSATFVLRKIMKRSNEKQKRSIHVFHRFEKAFDTVKHDYLKTWSLKRTAEQKIFVRIGEDVSEWFNEEGGVTQGRVLSPELFSLCTQLVMEERTE